MYLWIYLLLIRQFDILLVNVQVFDSIYTGYTRNCLNRLVNYLTGVLRMKMKNIATLIAAAAVITFVTAPLTSSIVSAKNIKCYGLTACKDKSHCKGKDYLLMSSKKCNKKGGTLTEPATKETASSNINNNTETTTN